MLYSDKEELRNILDRLRKKDHGSWTGPYSEGYESALDDVQEEIAKL